MINKLLYRLTAGLPCNLIKINGAPYLERYYVGSLLGVTFYLHRFVSCDGERHLHNHPWESSVAVVLAGSYLEQIATDICPHAGPSGFLVELRRVRWFNRIPGNKFHRIVSVAPGTWTLFCHSPRQRVGRGMASVEKGWGIAEREGNVTIFRPHISSPANWPETAPKGRDARRERL